MDNLNMRKKKCRGGYAFSKTNEAIEKVRTGKVKIRLVLENQK